MKFLTIVLGLILIGFAAAQTDQMTFEKLKQEADKLYNEKSYGLALDRYTEASKMQMPAAEARWVKFRIADCLWRSQSATNTWDQSKYDQAQAQIEAVIKDTDSLPEKDRVWAEANQSLGDFWWLRRNVRNWGQAWPFYEKALDWWGGSADLDVARDRYLKLIWNMT
ncbi:MAG TPA: hypothetical protein VFC63_24380, partial [Blastocatellia bacterium]|nr:hypothetical protein [Blastocatellia bacterium]